MREPVILSLEELNVWLAAAFPNRPGWNILDHQAGQRFQQQMEQVTLIWPTTEETAEVFVRVYRSYLSWWTLITPDLPQREHTAWEVAHRSGVPVTPILYRGDVDDKPGA